MKQNRMWTLKALNDITSVRKKIAKFELGSQTTHSNKRQSVFFTQLKETLKKTSCSKNFIVLETAKLCKAIKLSDLFNVTTEVKRQGYARM